jgi:1-acyl-sn-glycerol-3-phosphate acyltransferase
MLTQLKYKMNFIILYFYINSAPILTLFDFTIKTEIEFVEKIYYNIYKRLHCSIYRMTQMNVSHKKNIIYFANHRVSFTDLFMDLAVVQYVGTFVSRYILLLAIPGVFIFNYITNMVELFHRKQGKTDINNFEKMLKRIQETDRNILIYPEGTRRHGCDYACDLKKGSIYYSYKNDSPIQFVITYGKDDIANEKKLIAIPNLNAFVYYSKVYEQDYENTNPWKNGINILIPNGKRFLI